MKAPKQPWAVGVFQGKNPLHYRIDSFQKAENARVNATVLAEGDKETCQTTAKLLRLSALFKENFKEDWTVFSFRSSRRILFSPAAYLTPEYLRILFNTEEEDME